MNVNLQAILQEASIQSGGLFSRCLMLAGENEALRQQVSELEAKLKEAEKPKE